MNVENYAFLNGELQKFEDHLHVMYPDGAPRMTVHMQNIQAARDRVIAFVQAKTIIDDYGKENYSEEISTDEI